LNRKSYSTYIVERIRDDVMRCDEADDY